MIEPSLIEKPLPSPAHLSLFKKAQILANHVTKVFPFAFLTFSVIALAVAALYVYQAYDSLVNDWPSPPASLSASILCLLVVAGGMLLCLAGWRFPVLRLACWQILLIILGAGLGLYFSSQHVSYQTTCCQVAYLIGRGYPFTALRFSFAPNTALPYSWDQINELIRQHSDQITQDIAWHAVITNGLFYANAALIPIVLLRCVLRLFGGLVKLTRSHGGPDRERDAHFLALLLAFLITAHLNKLVRHPMSWAKLIGEGYDRRRKQRTRKSVRSAQKRSGAERQPNRGVRSPTDEGVVAH